MKRTFSLTLIAAYFATHILVGCVADNQAVDMELNTDHLQDVIWAIEPQFADLDYSINFNTYGAFSSGLACVRLENGETIFVGKDGENKFPEVSIAPGVRMSSNFTRQLPLAYTASGETYSFNITGEPVRSPDNQPSKQSTLTLDDKVGANYTEDFIVNTVLHTIQNSSAELISVRSTSDRYGLVNRLGQWVVQPEYNSIYVHNNGVVAQARMGRRNGFINDNLEFVRVSTENVRISEFEHGYARIERDSERDSKYYNFIDLDGSLVLENDISVRKSDRFPTLSEGLICYQNNNLYSIIDFEGNLVIKDQHKYIASFSEGLAYAENLQGRGGYIDKGGRFVISPRRNEYGGMFRNGMASFEVSRIFKNKTGVIDLTGEWVIKPRYDSVYYDGEYNIWILCNSKPGSDKPFDDFEYVFFVDSGKIVGRYEEVRLVSPTAFIGMQKSRAYIVDASGPQTVRYGFNDIDRLSEGLIAVKRGTKWGYIDAQGNLIVDFLFESAQHFSEGLAAVRLDGKWGFIANPLVYSSWEADEVDRAGALGLLPAACASAEITSGEFAELLEVAFSLEKNALKSLLKNYSNLLTRKTAAFLVASTAEHMGVYHKYFLPDSQDGHSVSADARYHAGFAVQAGIMKLDDFHFREEGGVSREEAYRIVLRVFEFSLNSVTSYIDDHNSRVRL